MNIKYLMVLLTGLLLLQACDKSMDLDTPAFDVTGYTLKNALDSNGNTVQNVVFDFQGNADLLSFYSGEISHDYSFKDGRIVKTKAIQMSFSSNCKLNSGSIALTNQLSVLASSDFSGKYADPDVHAATWSDITSRFTISSLVTTDDFKASGTVDISDLVVKGKSLYIAFKYITPPQTSTTRHTQWRIRDYLLNRNTDLGNTTIGSQATTPWTLFHTGPVESGRSSSTSSQLTLRGNNSAANFAQPTEDWAISPAIIIGDDADVGPDRPIAIKSRMESPLVGYTYHYAKPGTYTAAFLAVNVNSKDEKAVVRKLEIVVP